MEQLVKSLGNVNAKFPTHLVRQTGKSELVHLYFVHGRGLHHRMFVELTTLVSRQKAIEMVVNELQRRNDLDKLSNT